MRNARVWSVLIATSAMATLLMSSADGGNAAAVNVDAGVPRGEKGEILSPPVAPSLSPAALCDELHRSANATLIVRERWPEEQRKLTEERAKLEKLLAEITKSRDELRAESTRLEALLAKSGTKVPAREKQVADAGMPELPVVTATVDAGIPARSEEQLATLAKTVKSMKADQAATLVSRLDKSLAVDLLGRLNPATLGAVMGHLKPELAADLMNELASRPSRKGTP